MREQTDFIVIGSGIAGLRAAMGLSRAGGRVTVLTKDRVSESNTEYAQGGVAVVLSDDDQVDLHLQDTLEAGAGLCDQLAVRTLVEDGPKYIKELIEWGAQFDKEAGELVFTQEAAHSRRRILHAHGDSTGREIVRSLLACARSSSLITVLAHCATLELIIAAGRVVGVTYLNTETNQLCHLYAQAVMLATGGAGQLYQHTTNPDVATGDGMGMAYRAGAKMCDMEFVQFHPTALNLPNAPRFLISEAVRGEGGYLINNVGERFMSAYDERAELAPRDIVSRAIVAEMNKTHSQAVSLTIAHLAGDYIRERFPKIYQTCLQYNIDITKDPIPVSPAAHYIMGGVRTDIDGRTSLPGLYAAGEVASTGVHGANRLASNSLLEGLVFGARAAEAALQDSAAIPDKLDSLDIMPTSSTVIENWRLDRDIRKQVSELMWTNVGISREAQSLSEALTQLNQLANQPLNTITHNYVVVAQLITRAAQFRTESRGGHYRADFMLRDDTNWQVHTIDQLGQPLQTMPLS